MNLLLILLCINMFLNIIVIPSSKSGTSLIIWQRLLLVTSKRIKQKQILLIKWNRHKAAGFKNIPTHCKGAFNFISNTFQTVQAVQIGNGCYSSGVWTFQRFSLKGSIKHNILYTSIFTKKKWNLIGLEHKQLI